MPAAVHDRAINFRANGKLIDAAIERAHERGMSLSELIRAGIRSVTLDQPAPRETR